MLKVSKAEEKPSLSALMERHIAAQMATVNAVRKWDARRSAGEVSLVQYASALLPLSREEEEARVAIVLYKPLDKQESNRKLTYLAAYLIATKGMLKAGELEAITGAADLVG